MSNIVSGTVRLTSLLSEGIELMAAYNLAAESADAKFKFCSHQVLFDGKRTQNGLGIGDGHSIDHIQTAADGPD